MRLFRIYWDNFKYKYRFVDIPSKRLVKYLIENRMINQPFKTKYELVAHAWAYDSTVKDLEELSEAVVAYLAAKSRERTRQMLGKFMQVYKL